MRKYDVTKYLCRPPDSHSFSAPIQKSGLFFEEAPEIDDSLMFQDMNLSRPLLKVLCVNV